MLQLGSIKGHEIQPSIPCQMSDAVAPPYPVELPIGEPAFQHVFMRRQIILANASSFGGKR